MKVLTDYQTLGDIVKVNRTNEKHMGLETGQAAGGDKDVVESFAQTLNTALKKVNEKQVQSDVLANQMIVAPNSVNVHDVMIAAQEAQMSLNFLKQVRDRVVKAYQEIINMR